MDEESMDWVGDVVTHLEVDDNTEVEVDDEDEQSDLGLQGKACVEATVGKKGVSWRMRSPTPSPNSWTQKLKQGVRKNFRKHCHPPCSRS